MDFELTAEQRAIQALARDVAEAEIVPNATSWDREHRFPDELFPKLWLPGGWAGVYGAYQSQLKALMRMLGQPGGEVRPPRLPVTDEASLARLRAALVEAGLLHETTKAAS